MAAVDSSLVEVSMSGAIDIPKSSSGTHCAGTAFRPNWCRAGYQSRTKLHRPKGGLTPENFPEPRYSSLRARQADGVRGKG